MTKRPVWSWKDVRATAPATRRVVVNLDIETFDRLAEMAEVSGLGCAECAASILREVAADDAVAHGRGR
ncbi:hypothetical protein [Ancylobacter sp. TS-1]|uniref:hypothetical protein n=1 Tax=Ancylobacter sp. TS-1 TaxID=1850374 RepID=UPI001265C565|nr:hypothetical protein [Ancylobacter sp. TS-1]QFR32421.1 hypothetical protein GBB76_04415 [Ancylobacter sp. TS-1]